MRILVFSKAPWDVSNNLGNTLSNWFSGWKEDVFFHITTRYGIFNNNVCNDYFIVSEGDMLRNYYRPESIGSRVDSSRLSVVKSNEALHRKRNMGIQGIILSVMHRYPLASIYYLSMFLWNSGKWKNAKFRQFITDSNPDVFFAFLDDFYMLLPIIREVMKYTKARIVIYAADDTYNRRALGFLNNRFWKKNRALFEQTIRLADKLYGASPKLCDEYSRSFDVSVDPLYKGVRIDNRATRPFSPVVKIVYAGNLFYGRERVLMQVVEVLDNLYLQGFLSTFDVYCASELRWKNRKRMSTSKVARWMGGRHYDEIVEANSHASIVLHIESSEEQDIQMTRLSFSTKIIDALQSGACLLAYGPKDIASMEYIESIPGAIVVDDQMSLASALKHLISNPIEIANRARSSTAFAKEHHSVQNVHAQLRSDLSGFVLHESGN